MQLRTSYKVTRFELELFSPRMSFVGDRCCMKGKSVSIGFVHINTIYCPKDVLCYKCCINNAYFSVPTLHLKKKTNKKNMYPL